MYKSAYDSPIGMSEELSEAWSIGWNDRDTEAASELYNLENKLENALSTTEYWRLISENKILCIKELSITINELIAELSNYAYDHPVLVNARESLRRSN